MNTSVSVRQGALYGLLAHLFILIGGQLLFILVLGLYGSPVEISVVMLKTLELNPYAFVFFALLLAGGWFAGYKLTEQIIEKGKGVLASGLLFGLLIAVITMAYWLIVTIAVAGTATIPSLKEPAAVAFIVFIIHWLIIAALIKKKAKTA